MIDEEALRKEFAAQYVAGMRKVMKVERANVVKYIRDRQRAHYLFTVMADMIETAMPESVPPEWNPHE